MKRRADPNESLLHARHDRIEQAARALLVDDDAGAAERHLAWVETADKVIRARRPAPLHTVYVAGIILLACLTVVVLARTWHLSANPLRMRVQANAVGFKPATEWVAITHQRVIGLSVRNLSEVESSSLGVQPASALSLDPFDGRIIELKISAGAEVELESGPRMISLFVKHGRVSGEFLVVNAVASITDDKQRKRRERWQSEPKLPPEWVRVVADHNGQAKPVRIDLSYADGSQFSGVQISGLGFTREFPTGSGEWVSNIQSVKGEFPDTGRKITLKKSDWLKLDGMAPTRISIGRSAEGFTVDFDGEVHRVEAGRNQSALRNILPPGLNI